MTPSAVIASQRVGAKRRPRTGSAKQSMPPQKERMDCFVARAPRNDGRGCRHTKLVMPGLVPGIHVFDAGCWKKDVDGRVKPGHDGMASPCLRRDDERE